MTVRISEFQNHVGESVTIRGWVYNLRSSGSIAFFQLRDGFGFTQAVFSKNDVSEDMWNQIQSVTIESSVSVTGVVTPHPKKENVFELQATAVEIFQIAQEFPIGKKEHGPDFLLDNRHVWIRSQTQWAVLRVRSEIMTAIFDWMRENGYTRLDTPILTANACEGTTDLFELPYFEEKKAYLAQTGQLYLEAAIASLGRCYDFGPVFRAEKSKTRRHLTEFWMMDAEAAFMTHSENMDAQEDMVCFIVRRVLERCRQEFEIVERDVSKLEAIQKPFPRLTHADAVSRLQKMGSDIQERDDLGADDETKLTNEFERPIFIEKYPAEVKAFYMKRDPNDETRCLNADLLAPEGYGEIIGGSERESDLDMITKRIIEHHLSPDVFSWYLDLRRYGSVPHSGFGLGLERIVTWICGRHHVRESIPFPRLLNRLEP
ncbi:MAG: asparagine--tRNA ligase [bacterium]|nr:asparagine--tRNA ligase [bacterium]